MLIVNDNVSRRRNEIATRTCFIIHHRGLAEFKYSSVLLKMKYRNFIKITITFRGFEAFVLFTRSSCVCSFIPRGL